MATAVIMPRQGQSVESCIITSWSKKVGDEVKEGDILFSYETDKSSFDEAAAVSGTVLAILKGEGDEVPCLENVCINGNPGEDISAFAAGAPTEKAASPAAPAEAEAKVLPASATVKSEETDRLFASPRARALAEKAGVPVEAATATGPDGRIIERDVMTLLDKGYTKAEAAPAEAQAPVRETVPAASAPAPAAGPAYEDIKLSNVRKVIARSMHDSLANGAQLTLNASFDATAIQQYRAFVKADGEKLGLANITLNDIVVFAAARTLEDFKDLNAHFLDDRIRVFADVHMGIAVDTERGLLVPTVANANKMSLNELAAASKSIISEAKGGHISPDKLSGASFTVTNLGSFGIESFTPVINPPQVAILGVCGITTRVREEEGRLAAYPAMGLSLTIDHRAVDGAPGAKFLKALCRNLENFSLLLAK